MARKSRKVTVAMIAPEIDPVCHAAVYVRLSVEDKQSGSISIETQQLIITRFLEQYPEISVYDTYIDNGLTGTNFKRPAFQRMLSDIENGLVNCVVVKDLSRLGRNAIDTGYYLEQYFPARRVRFISVNENYDTANPDSAQAYMMIPLRNMINEAYALDIGKKIKAAQRQMMKDGKYVGGRPPYGYLKAPEDCHQLIIDPVASPVVRQIFQWVYEGAGLNTIVVRLNEAGYLPPSHYKREQGLISDKMLGNGKWQTRTILSILHNEIYTGDLVQGHTKTIDHKQVKAAPEEATIVRGTHEAIVGRELFDAVQAALEKTGKTYKARAVTPFEANPLRGKIFCACCDRSLHWQRNKRDKAPDLYFYYCLSKSRVSKEACPGVFILRDALMTALTDIVLESLDAALGRYALCMEAPAQQTERRNELVRKIAAKRQERTRAVGLSQSLYENLTLGIITREEYFALKERYSAQLGKVKEELEQLEAGLTVLDRQLKQYQALRKDAASIRKDKALTMELIQRLIERVEVSTEKEITVRFHFQSEFEQDGRVLEQCKVM